MRKIKEAIALFDNGDTRSFNQIYAGKEDLFEEEDIDGIISPKMKKLFEEVYEEASGKRLREDAPNHPGCVGKPAPDGVPNGHNPPLSKGPTSEVTQSGTDFGNNPKFFESMKDIYEKAQLKEVLEDEFSFDAVGGNDFEDLDVDNIDDLSDDWDDSDYFDDGTEFGSDYKDEDEDFDIFDDEKNPLRFN